MTCYIILLNRTVMVKLESQFASMILMHSCVCMIEYMVYNFYKVSWKRIIHTSASNNLLNLFRLLKLVSCTPFDPTYLHYLIALNIF